jgi:hypothetical protein
MLSLLTQTHERHEKLEQAAEGWKYLGERRYRHIFFRQSTTFFSPNKVK